MSQISTYEKKTLDAVITMLNIDKYDPEKGSRIQQILQMLMDSKDFVKMISNDIKAVMADKKINMADFPKLMSIGLQANTFLTTLKIDSAELKAEETCVDSLKYIIFGAIYFGLCMANADDSTLSIITMLYPGLWELLKINPAKIKAGAKSLFKK